MKRGTPDHIKTKRLVRELRIPIYSAVGLLEMLFHFAAKHTPRGNVGRYPDNEIAEALGWHGEGTRLVGAMHKAGYLDAHPEHRWVIHDWHDHADEAVKKTLKRQGVKFIVSGQSTDMSGQRRDMSRLPEPILAMPEPEPIPLGTPDISDLVLYLKSNHPQHRTCLDERLIVEALMTHLGGALKPDLIMAEIRSNHEAWKTSTEWQRENGRAVPGLVKWIREKALVKPQGEEDWTSGL